MTFRTLIRRSLRYYWRSHLGVVIGAAIGSAALIGALIVGDSVKGSLRERALLRLGESHFLLQGGDRFFLQDLGGRMARDPMDLWREDQLAVFFQGGPAAALSLPGIASRQDGGAMAHHVQLLGLWQQPSDVRGNHYYDFWSYASGNMDGPIVKPGEVYLNQPLAAQLRAKLGDYLLFRVHKPDVLSSDAPISARSDNTAAIRLRVSGIIPDDHLGLFSPRASAAPVMNAFVNLGQLQSAADLEGRGNLLLGGAVLEGDESLGNAVYQATTTVAGSKVAYNLRSLIQTGWRVRQADLAQQDYQAELKSKARLEDYEAQLHFHDDNRTVMLDSRRVFLDSPIASAALAADANAQPILTYLANLITDGTNATPYSMVTAAGAPWTTPDLRDDEIVINQWLADDLQAQPGDELALVYYDPESGARLTERTNTFRVRSVVPMQIPWADRTLMPQFPGIEKAETTAEWDTAFPLVHTIRSQDDDYWTDYRGTPKAFITLAAGKKMWANRFGNLTAIRFPVPVSRPEGGQPTSSVEAFQAELGEKILATLKPEELGLRFEPVREQALKAAEQSQDFGGLFIGFSLFVIVAALLLMALLFQFGLEQRAGEIGTLLALGLAPKQVRRLFLREGVVLAFIGGVLGAVAGVAYAKVMLLGLVTVWRDAVGTSTLKFFATPQTLLIGLFASTLVAAFTLWLALRKQVKRPARELLAGGPQDLKSEGKLARSKKGMIVAMSAGIAALGLVGWTLVNGDTGNAGAFFGAGALVLIAGLSFLNARLTQRFRPSAILTPLSSRALALRGLGRRRSRSVATAAMLASGTFLVVSIGVFRLDANRDATVRSSGTGGFALIGESTMPVVADLNTKAGRESYALDEADLENVNVVQFRVRQGDEASCLNLNRAQKPRLLGVQPEQLKGRFTFVTLADGMLPDQPWQSLELGEFYPKYDSPLREDEIAAIGDANSIQWAMGKKVGDTIDYVDERGQPFKVRIVGAVANSILQGQLIINEAEFVKRFPGESGYKYFLLDAPTDRVADLSARLSRALQDVGLEVTPAPVRLAQFNAVQNTYLGTFQVLGGLGLLLGSAGLGIVVLRNVLERRGELAVLIAVGWQPAVVRKLVLTEHAALLGLGLMVGLFAAAISVMPSVMSAGSQLPLFSLTVTLLLVLANGLAFTWLATRFALRGELLNALRNE